MTEKIMFYKLVVFLLCVWAALLLAFAFYGAYTASQVAPEPYRIVAGAFGVLTVIALAVGTFVYWLHNITGD